MIKVFRFLAMCTISVAFATLTIASAQVYTSIDKPQVLSNAVVNKPIQFDVSRPLAELASGSPGSAGRPFDARASAAKAAAIDGGSAAPRRRGGSHPAAVDRLPHQCHRRPELRRGRDGRSRFSTTARAVVGFHVAPPDTNAAVGDTQVVQWVNVCYAVFDKCTGATIVGPFAGNAFWQGFGGPCETSNDGDIIIQWDKSNHRWLAAQNVFSAPYMTCIAISQTADATGSYYRYAFPQPGFPDYPKWGLTRNVYYQSQNIFDPDPRLRCERLRL